MENLFKYATKELSQDAFLCWLFANYECEQEEVSDFSRYMLSWLITDNLSLENGKQITEVKIKKQIKNIDVAIECKFFNVPHVVIIEDKTSSTAHDEQLNRYQATVNDTYGDTYKKCFVFFKTDLIGKEEKEKLKTYGGWRVEQAQDIYEVFNSFLESRCLSDFNNEILHYYYENLIDIFSDIKHRPQKVSEWSLRAWHSFFEDYTPVCGLKPDAEIRSYQKQYFYYKFIIDRHENDLPCIEVRSRDYHDTVLKFRVVLYNVDNAKKTEENISKWKDILTWNGIKTCNRIDPAKNQQIGIFERKSANDTEAALKNVFDEVGQLLLRLYAH